MEDDGTRPFGSEFSPDQRRPLSLIVGDQVTIDIQVVNPVGAVMRFGAGEFVVIDGRSLCLPSRPLFTVRSTTVDDWKQRIIITSDTTRLWTPQRGLFDLWAVRTAGRLNLIPLSELVIAGSALGNNYL